MKRFLIAAFILIASVSMVYAEELKMGFVDIQKALNESDSGKKAMGELEGQRKKTQTKINDKIAAKEKMQAELDKQENVLSPEAKREKTDEIEKMERDIENTINEANTDLQKKLRNLNLSILSELNEVIDDFGKTEGYAIIFPADAVIYTSKAVDITDSVIKRYNDRYQKALKASDEKKDEKKGESKPKK